MATVSPPTKEPLPKPGAGRTVNPVIQFGALNVIHGSTPVWKRLIPAWVISAVSHGVFLVLFLIVGGPTVMEAVKKESAVILETKIEENTKPPDLTNEDVGLDPEVPTNYDVSRIADVSVPGEVKPEEAIGIANAPEGPPKTIAPPPGMGNNRGDGAGVDSSVPGTAALTGLSPGGMTGAKGLIAGGFGGRSGATREKMVKEGGGNAASEAAVAKGLAWLKSHQAPDGHWSMDGFHQHGKCNCTGPGQSNDIAGTAFGLLPMLGAGQTHKDKNSPYAKNIERGLKYLIVKQSRDGDFGGGMYAHGLATITVCEAYGLTADPQLKDSCLRAVRFIINAQSDNGGWRYAPRQGGDTSVVGWQVMGLKSAQMSGFDVPTKTLLGAAKWLDSCATPDGGSYGYTDSQATPTMSSVGLLCREYLGWGPRNPGLISGVSKLKLTPPTAAGGIYYNYYATQVMHHMGGDAWDFWNPKIRDLMIARQDQGNDPKHPHQKGSWGPTGDPHGGVGGRIMLTSMSLLTLEVYYRHLPLYRRDMAVTK